MKLVIVFLFVVVLLILVKCPANGKSSTEASTNKSPKRSHKHGIFNSTQSYLKNQTSSSKTSSKGSPGKSSHNPSKSATKQHHPQQPSSNKGTKLLSGSPQQGSHNRSKSAKKSHHPQPFGNNRSKFPTKQHHPEQPSSNKGSKFLSGSPQHGSHNRSKSAKKSHHPQPFGNSRLKFPTKHPPQQPSSNKGTNSDSDWSHGRGILSSLKETAAKEKNTKGQSKFASLSRKENAKATNPKGRNFNKLLGKGKSTSALPKISTGKPKITTTTTTTPAPTPAPPPYKEASPLPEDAPCSAATKDAAWVDQVKIGPCHYNTDTHPRQQARRKWDPENNAYDADDYKSFHHLAIFNIKHDLDFQEAGEPCSTFLQQQFMNSEMVAEEWDPYPEGTNYTAPVDIEVMSYNRAWYKKVCSFFSYLECVPKKERRRKYNKLKSKKEKRNRRKRNDYDDDDDDDSANENDNNDSYFGNNDDDDSDNDGVDDDTDNDDGFPESDDVAVANNDDDFPDADDDFPDADDNVAVAKNDDNVAVAKNDNNVAVAKNDDNLVVAKNDDNLVVAKNDDNVAPKKRLNTKKHKSHRLPAMDFKDSGLDTTGLLRLKIGGRGPGKARHKSGPGGGRLDPRALKGMSEKQKDGYKYDGTCVCSYRDPAFPERVRPDYGMDFVEDEARPRWCVAGPGNLCGRVYFKRNIWPGQQYYEFSDHIGCPKRYKGEEYECVRWTKDPTVKTNRTNFPNSHTSTCEKKPVDVEMVHENKLYRKNMKLKRKNTSSASNCRIDMILFTTLIVIVLEMMWQ